MAKKAKQKITAIISIVNNCFKLYNKKTNHNYGRQQSPAAQILHNTMTHYYEVEK